MTAISTWWLVGWGVGVVVVLAVAVLVLAITALAQRIARQAQEITVGLDGVREHTGGLWDVRTTNAALDRIARGLRAARGG